MAPVQPEASTSAVGASPKYHLKPVAVGWPSEPLTRGFAERTCVVWSFAAGTFQFSSNVAVPPEPYWLMASIANVSGLTAPANSAPVKSGPPAAEFVRTEFQHPAPPDGSPPPFGSHGPVSVIEEGGFVGLPKRLLSLFLMRGVVPASSIALPAWKSKSKFQPKPVRGCCEGAGATAALMLTWSPTNTVAPLESGRP